MVCISLYLQYLGLDIPITKSRGLTKDELKQKEDELTAYFLHEMRKQPVPQKSQ